MLPGAGDADGGGGPASFGPLLGLLVSDVSGGGLEGALKCASPL